MMSNSVLLAIWSIGLLLGEAVELASSVNKAQSLNHLMRSSRGQHSSHRLHSDHKREDGNGLPDRNRGNDHGEKHKSKAVSSGRRTSSNDVDAVMAVQSNGALKMRHTKSARENPQLQHGKRSCLHGADTCMHRVSRLRPHKVHQAAGFKIHQTPTTSGVPDTTTLPDIGSPYYPLPTSIKCTLRVDDVLDAIYYNGTALSKAGTADIKYGAAETTCATTVFTITPVSGANLTIIAHDSTPGTGLSTCAGIGISCTIGDTQTPYPQINTYGFNSWKVRGQYTALLESPGEWNVIGKGTSTSTACGLNPSAAGTVQMWQSGYVYVAAQWTTPIGVTTVTTTTTTITNATINITKAAAGATVPNLIQLALGLFILISYSQN